MDFARKNASRWIPGFIHRFDWSSRPLKSRARVAGERKTATAQRNLSASDELKP
jgi:hypothetical protein